MYMILSFGKGWRRASGGARILSSVLTICVVVGISYFYRDWRETRDFVPQDFNMFMEVERSEREIERYTELMEKAYREDTYGGDTPEETLKLFTDALRVGDTELAARYFVVEKQLQRKEIFGNWERNNRLVFIAEALRYYGETAYPIDNNAQITSIIDGKPSVVVFFVRNTQTNKWKIESL